MIAIINNREKLFMHSSLSLPTLFSHFYLCNFCGFLLFMLCSFFVKIFELFFMHFFFDLLIALVLFQILFQQFALHTCDVQRRLTTTATTNFRICHKHQRTLQHTQHTTRGAIRFSVLFARLTEIAKRNFCVFRQFYLYTIL